MREFPTSQALREAWVSQMAYQMSAGVLDARRRADTLATAWIMVRTAAVYVPHLYRGGWVIRGFGYSTERIGEYVTAERAGNPLLV